MNAVSLMSDAELEQLSREPAGIGVLQTARGCLPLTDLNVTANIEGLTAGIELAQTFRNTLDEPLEATYIFPLPDRAAVTRFQMEVGGRVIEGMIDERGRARANYEQAIASGQRAAIAEEDRAGVFTLRVGNILPQETAVVHLSLVGPLPFDEGEASFCFPLVVAPRYIPGVGLPGPQAGSGIAADTDAVPDASRITPPLLLPGFPNPVRLAIEVSVTGCGLPVSALRSSLHAVITSEIHGTLRVVLQPGERLNRDFILRWRLGDAQIRSSALLVPDADGAAATCLITVVPPVLDAGVQHPRDVVFVLDRSGSMRGWKMVAARRAVARMVDSLGAQDRFAVMAFDDRIEMPGAPLPSSLANASDRQRFRAVEFLARIDARGGTELLQPLEQGARLLASDGTQRERVLILVTDGQVGNEDEILRHLAASMQRVRVFALGIDSAVNAAFLRRLAAMGGGACELVESEERLDEVMAKVHRRIAQPVVTELRLEGEGVQLQADSMAPARLPDLFTGAPLLVAVRLAKASSGTIVIHGRTPAGRPWSQGVALQTGAAPAAAALWARAHIRDLEDSFAIGQQDQAALEQQIVAVSQRHRVLSRFTAFIAVDRSAQVNPHGSPRMVTQAVELPDGWDLMERASAPSLLPPAPSAAMPLCRERNALGGASRMLLDRAKRIGRSAPAAAKPAKVAVPDAESAAAIAPPTDLAPYLQRIRELADAVERTATGNDHNGLDLATARLRELIEDLRSVIPNAPLLRALTLVADGLRGLLEAASPVVAEVRRMAAELRSLAEPGAVPPPDADQTGARRSASTRRAQRWQFWKS